MLHPIAVTARRDIMVQLANPTSTNVHLIHAKMEEHVKIQSMVTHVCVIIPDLTAVTARIVSHNCIQSASMLIHENLYTVSSHLFACHP